jgi:hypothetical protein
MEIMDDATRERINAKLSQIQAAQRNARAHIKDVDSAQFDAAMQEAEQCVRDMERMVA